MKKLLLVPAVIALSAAGLFAQELAVSGEMKTGFYWEEKQIGGRIPTSEGRVHNNDDAGKEQGRFRLNLQVDKDNFGMKMRFQQHEDWRDKALPGWGYAFAYGSFFENQFKLSAGKLGDSPWGTGGPEMWQELDTRIGIRAEYMPGFLPGLNLGFVLNDINSTEDRTVAEKTLLNMLEESVVGFSYINDYFLVRFAYRFDSILDDDKGGQLVYRLEERVLNNFLPGFQIWANGYYTGIGDDDELQGSTILQNWLYLQYAPEDFTAQLRLGYDVMGKRANIFYLRPSFYYNFFNNFLSAGLSFSFGQEFGDEVRNPGKPYLYWELQPMIRLNFGNAYVALVYQYSSDYKYRDTNTMENLETKWQWVNLRVVFTF